MEAGDEHFPFPIQRGHHHTGEVAYIYGLPIDGSPVTGRTYTHYQIDELCQELLGVVPQPKEDYNGIPLKFTWLERVFCPTPDELREKEKTKQKGKKKSKGHPKKKKKMTEAKEKCRTRAYLFFWLLDRFFVILQGHEAPFIF